MNDEEIEKAAKDFANSGEGDVIEKLQTYDAFDAGAKWLRDTYYPRAMSALAILKAIGDREDVLKQIGHKEGKPILRAVARFFEGFNEWRDALLLEMVEIVQDGTSGDFLSFKPREDCLAELKRRKGWG